MIDIDEANIEFNRYVSGFDSNDGRIKLKIDHIKRVSGISRKIAQNLNLDSDQIKLAELIGLFHDIGRFEQIKLYNTFNDKESVNHAELGVKLLFDDNLIDKFNLNEDYKKIVKQAILNHNKNEIDSNLNKDEVLFSKIIRDADKLDICYIICNDDFSNIFWYSDFNSGAINDIAMNDFFNKHRLDYTHIKTNSDQILMFFSYIFDLNFDFSLKFLKEQKYLDKFADRIYENFTNDLVKKQTSQILKFSNEFLNKK